MKALVKYKKGFGNMEIRDLSVPELADNEVLIKVEACGICGTDLKIYEDRFMYNYPIIVGHEFSGTIVSLGKKVYGWNVSDRVVSEQHTKACGVCSFCLTGKRHLCPQKQAPGYGVDGAFAEYIKVPFSLLHKIPESISMEEATLFEPMAVAAYGILEKTMIKPQEYVVIMGCGAIALLAVQLVKAVGASKILVTGIDADEKSRFSLAEEFGAYKTVNTSKDDPVRIVMQETGDMGADVVIDLSGAPQAITQGLDLIKKNGRFCALGLTNQNVSIAWEKTILKAITVFFSYSSDYISWERCISMVNGSRVNLRKYTDSIYSLEDWENAFEFARSGKALKVIIKP